jgi:hypothetical protein
VTTVIFTFHKLSLRRGKSSIWSVFGLGLAKAQLKLDEGGLSPLRHSPGFTPGSLFEKISLLVFKDNGLQHQILKNQQITVNFIQLLLSLCKKNISKKY